MYLNFYNMKKPPFHITPDPEFLYLSPSHKEALGAIIYGITKRKGFVSIFGEVGTGKTTIVRSYLAKSDKTRIKPIYVFNPSVTFAELLKTIFQELGVEPHNESVYEMVQQLHTVLILEYAQNHNIVLIIDEAQNMPASTFEQLRILSNLETSKEKLLQIILVGQPELAEKLAGKKLRQLNQRLAIRATLSHLSPEESRHYILFRLAKVTPSVHDIFTPDALKKIVKAAQGSPRMLNILCDNALIAGFGYKEERVTGSIVKQVIADFEGKGRPPLFTWQYASLFGAFLLSAAALNGIHTFLPFAQSSFGRNEQLSTTSSLAKIETKAQLEQSLPAQESDRSNNGVKVPGKKTLYSSDTRTGTASPSQFDILREDSAPTLAVSQDENKHANRLRVSRSLTPVEDQKSFVPSSSSPKAIKTRQTMRTVKRGEYLSQICLDMYGFVNDQLIQAVKEKNPGIFDPDLIFIGDTIFFPELLILERRRTDS
ncbi:MAG: AAA family ATPase [Desulfobacteraceae bacterium]|nr:AAA family ATPase [Desulfobacteraceae bacterium]